MAFREFFALKFKWNAQFATSLEIAASPGGVSFDDLPNFTRWTYQFIRFSFYQMNL